MKRLFMRAVLACACLYVATFAFAADAATEQKLTQMENDLWNGWKSHNSEPFKKSLAADAIDLTGQGVMMGEAMTKEIESTNCSVTSFAIDNPSFKWLDKNTALMTYHATQEATCGGEKIPPAVWAATLWMKKGSEWKAVFHQETVDTKK